MGLQTFEFIKKWSIPQITFFRKVRDTNIHSESLLKFGVAHFDMLHNLTYVNPLEKKKFLNFLVENFQTYEFKVRIKNLF